MLTRCKFRCIEAKNSGTSEEPIVEATLSVVGGDTPENKEFFKYTPGGVLRFYALRRDVFRLNAEYYADFSAVGETEPAASSAAGEGGPSSDVPAASAAAPPEAEAASAPEPTHAFPGSGDPGDHSPPFDDPPLQERPVGEPA